MISLKTIAEECGVSVATVSKALNDQKISVMLPNAVSEK